MVFLVPIAHDRYELYSEVPEDAARPPDATANRFRKWTHSLSVRWRELVERARRGGTRGRVARWRDALVSRLAESIAEQRTLWALRCETAVTLRYPSTIDASDARTALHELLGNARRHHGRWLIVDLLLFIASGVLFFVPGPNIIAYYLALRVFGLLNSWRGARNADQHIAWTLEGDDYHAELGCLVGTLREARAPRVAQIAMRLNLLQLAAFFDRVAA